MNPNELYEKVLQLHKQGFGSRRIAKRLNVNRKSFEHWIYPKGTLFKPRPQPNLESSPELAYVIGVILSDGTLYHGSRSRKYEIKLAAKDKDFVEEFRRCLLKVSKRKVSFFVANYPDTKLWVATTSCKDLYFFLKDKPKNFHDVITQYPNVFIRGFADGDGSAYISNKSYNYVAVGLYNSNLSLLKFIQKLLRQCFQINSKIYINTGSEKTKKIPWRLLIVKQVSVRCFFKRIGFTIKRKQQVLEVKAI